MNFYRNEWDELFVSHLIETFKSDMGFDKFEIPKENKQKIHPLSITLWKPIVNTITKIGDWLKPTETMAFGDKTKAKS